MNSVVAGLDVLVAIVCGHDHKDRPPSLANIEFPFSRFYLLNRLQLALFPSGTAGINAANVPYPFVRILTIGLVNTHDPHLVRHLLSCLTTVMNPKPFAIRRPVRSLRALFPLGGEITFGQFDFDALHFPEDLFDVTRPDRSVQLPNIGNKRHDGQYFRYFVLGRPP